MKVLFLRLALILSICLFSFVSQANNAPLSHLSCASLYDHLVEVNAEWLHVNQKSNSILSEQVSFDSEAIRIQRHLSLVIEILQSKKSFHEHNRSLLLNALSSYAAKAQFPINAKHTNRTPYFVDHNNTHCAVGFLMKENGDQKLIEKIRKKYNNDYIANMPQAELSQWANKNGFTTEELKWIQPGYPPQRQQYFTLGSNGGADGSINCMAKDNEDKMLYIGGAFVNIDGQLANGIIAWDGEAWHTMANGLDGVVNDIYVHGEHVYVVGDFKFFGQDETINVAEWNGEAWIALQTGAMGGYINAVTYLDGEVFIGGNFSMVDGAASDNIARFNNYQQKWYDHAVEGQKTIQAGFGVNGEVNDLVINNNNLILVVGSFTETAPTLSGQSSVSQQVNKLCYWNRFQNNWNFSSNFPGSNITTATIVDNTLYTASSIFDDNLMYINQAGVWKSISSQSFDAGYLIEGDGMAHKMVSHNDDIYVLNGFGNYVIVGTQGSGIAKISSDGDCYLSPASHFDKPVRAGISFQDHLYFGGDFTQTYGVDENGNTTTIELNNLGYSRFDGLASSVSKEDKQVKFKVYQTEDFLNIHWSALNNRTQLHLINIDGKKIESCLLEGLSGSKIIPLQKLPEGIYFYQITDGMNQKSEKIYINRS